MLCPRCYIEFDAKDFYGKNLCYRCVYEKKKIALIKKFCAFCNDPIPENRRLYCSKRCMVKANNQRWYEEVRAPQTYYGLVITQK